MYAIRSYYASLGNKKQATAEAPAPEPIALTGDRIDELTGLANENGMLAWFRERAKRIAEDGRITSYNVCYTKLLR